MNHLYKLYFSICILFANICVSQTVEKYSFKNYEVEKISKNKKAKIDYQSNKIATRYKTAITENYNLGEVNFAGHYIVCTWGCGVGCLDRAMVDIYDGKVYKIPLGEQGIILVVY